MVDLRVCRPKADIELADVVRRFGTQYVSQYSPAIDARAAEGADAPSPPLLLIVSINE